MLSSIWEAEMKGVTCLLYLLSMAEVCAMVASLLLFLDYYLMVAGVTC